MKKLLSLLVFLFASFTFSQAYQVNLTCTAPTSPSGVTITGFQFYRATGTSTTFSVLNTTPATTCSYSDTTVANSTVYQYYAETVVTVTGVTGSQSSIPSSTISVTVPGTVPPPTNPSATITAETVAAVVNPKTGQVTATVKFTVTPDDDKKVTTKKNITAEVTQKVEAGS